MRSGIVNRSVPNLAKTIDIRCRCNLNIQFTNHDLLFVLPCEWYFSFRVHGIIIVVCVQRSHQSKITYFHLCTKMYHHYAVVLCISHKIKPHDHYKSYVIALHHNTAHRITSHRSTPHRITTHDTASHYTTSHRITPHRITQHRITPHRIASHLNTSPHSCSIHTKDIWHFMKIVLPYHEMIAEGS